MTVVSNCGVADKDRLINDNPNPNSNSNSTSAAQTQVNQKLQPSQESSSANKSASSPMSSNPGSSANYQTIAYPVAFGAGILSFLSPCILPLIPSFVAFITGMSIWPNKQKNFRQDIGTSRGHIEERRTFQRGFS
ncbi:MAG: cytochrome c biogenesis protein CcdA [Nitrososphaeraceae archaeon]